MRPPWTAELACLCLPNVNLSGVVQNDEVHYLESMWRAEFAAVCSPSVCILTIVQTKGSYFLESVEKAEFAVVCVYTQAAHFYELSEINDFTTWSLCGGRNLQLYVYPKRPLESPLEALYLPNLRIFKSCLGFSILGAAVETGICSSVYQT